MPRCSYCNCKLPGAEHLCRSCYDAHYALIREPKISLRERLIRFAHAAPVTTTLLAINIVVFLAFALLNFSLHPTEEQLIRWGGEYAPLTLSGQWWRLLTCLFLHAGYLHVLLNMQCLAILGPLAERAFGTIRFTLGYFCAGICASTSSVIVHPHQVCIGASGAIFGIVGMLITPMAFGQLSFSFKKDSHPLWSLVTFSLFSLLIGAILPMVDNGAHLAGLLSGMGLGLAFAIHRRTVALENDELSGIGLDWPKSWENKQ